ncbi:hypothetical protein [Amycolatopsis orientalis]|nr:hypothetical protein [Amycolatopsis orientalis]
MTICLDEVKVETSDVLVRSVDLDLVEMIIEEPSVGASILHAPNSVEVRRATNLRALLPAALTASGNPASGSAGVQPGGEQVKQPAVPQGEEGVSDYDVSAGDLMAGQLGPNTHISSTVDSGTGVPAGETSTGLGLESDVEPVVSYEPLMAALDDLMGGDDAVAAGASVERGEGVWGSRVGVVLGDEDSDVAGGARWLEH